MLIPEQKHQELMIGLTNTFPLVMPFCSNENKTTKCNYDSTNKNAFGSSKSFSQSSRELLTINALVKPPKDIINDTIPNQSIIFLARLFFVEKTLC